MRDARVQRVFQVGGHADGGPGAPGGAHRGAVRAEPGTRAVAYPPRERDGAPPGDRRTQASGPATWRGVRGMSADDETRPDLERIEQALVAAVLAMHGKPTSVILADFLTVLRYAQRVERERAERA